MFSNVIKKDKTFLGNALTVSTVCRQSLAKYDIM